MAQEFGVPTGLGRPGSRRLLTSNRRMHMGTQRCPRLAEALLERFPAPNGHVGKISPGG